MKPMRVYVAAPYADAALVREVHGRLRAQGHEPTSSWAEIELETAKGEFRDSAEMLRAAAIANDADLIGSDVVLVLAREGVGGEMFAEARLALVRRIPVVWVGRRILSTYRDGVTIAADLDDAMKKLDR